MKEKELEKLASSLARKHYPVKTEWLQKCVEYLEKTSERVVSLPNEMFNLIVQQILNSKISDALNPVMKIPTSAAKVVIVKRMVFEITSFTNISVSLYEQLSECTQHENNLSWFHECSKIDHDDREKEKDTTFQSNDKNNNIRAVTKKHGMLKLNLTDGVNTVKAIELEEVFDENLLKPGAKMILTGRVKCRHGVLLIDKSNCHYLGGQVESLNEDKAKQLSAALNVDLDGEKKRRQKSLEEAAASVNQIHKRVSDKKNASLNQSTISPFLVKTNRKTGEVTNPPKPIQEAVASSISSRPADPEPGGFSIEEIPARSPQQLAHLHETRENAFIWNEEVPVKPAPPPPPPPPTKRLSSLVLDESLPANSTKKSKFSEGSPVKEWEFNSFSSLEKTSNPNVKQLPDQLLRSDVVLPRPMFGNPGMHPEKRKEISEWMWDDRKGSEEEEGASKQKKDDSVMEIPRCFMKEKVEKISHADPERAKVNTFNLHGPRKRIEVKSKSPSIFKNTSPKSVVNLVEECLDAAIKPLIIPETVENCSEEGEDEEEEIDEIIPATLFPPPHFERFEQFEEEEREDSIMECTIDQEGRMECERWGLLGKKRPTEEYNTDFESNSYSCKKKASDIDFDKLLNNIITSEIAMPSAAIQIQREERRDIYCPPKFLNQFSPSQQFAPPPPPPPNWTFPEQQSIKTERIETQLMRIPEKKKTINQEIEEIKNKQSANVQIYKTPFAKRLNSSDSSTDATCQLFQRISDLQIVPFADALINRKFWMMSKIVVVMPTICHQLHELKSDGVDWLLQISVTDTSASNIKCRVATDLLNRLFGFNVQQCKNLFNSNHVEELRTKKAEAERKLHGFKRLDLLIWIEVSPELEKLPMILDVKTISDALNIL